MCQTWRLAAALVRVAVDAHDGERGPDQSDELFIHNGFAGVKGLLRSAFRPATRLVRQWGILCRSPGCKIRPGRRPKRQNKAAHAECQQPGDGEASPVSCLVHDLAQAEMAHASAATRVRLCSHPYPHIQGNCAHLLSCYSWACLQGKWQTWEC